MAAAAVSAWPLQNPKKITIIDDVTIIQQQLVPILSLYIKMKIAG